MDVEGGVPWTLGELLPLLFEGPSESLGG
jgi:hypothetical protein